ncbi:MAG: PilZ domain-containing protein [Labilithrix sp.]|nr:PilZ domain-containing protein [Labilithrix sp.]
MTPAPRLLRRLRMTDKKTTPTPQGMKVPSGVHAMRRGGARREVTERVTLKTESGAALEGWALNVSRGGLRAILEEKVELGQKFEVAIGTDEALLRPSRVVWVQEEPDGVIVGLEFTGLSGTHKSAPPPPPNGDGSDDA